LSSFHIFTSPVHDTSNCWIMEAAPKPYGVQIGSCPPACGLLQPGRYLHGVGGRDLQLARIGDDNALCWASAPGLSLCVS
jgi:hypothetical protein